MRRKTVNGTKTKKKTTKKAPKKSKTAQINVPVALTLKTKVDKFRRHQGLTMTKVVTQSLESYMGQSA